MKNQDIVAERKLAKDAIRIVVERSEALGKMFRVISEMRLDSEMVLEAAANHIAELIGDVCAIYLLAGDGKRLNPIALSSSNSIVSDAMREIFPTIELPANEGLAGQILATGEPILIAESAQHSDLIEPQYMSLVEKFGVQSLILVPVRNQNRSIGMLVSVRMSTGNPYNSDEQTFLQELADLSGLATENARLYQHTERHTAQLEALHQGTLNITARLDLEELLRALTENLLGLLDARSAGLYLHQEAAAALELAVAVGEDQLPIGTQLKCGEGLAGKVWEIGEAQAVDNYSPWDGRARPYEGHARNAAICAPIFLGEQLLGAISVEASSKYRRFSEYDIKLLIMFADQAAIAIHSAQLYEAERRERILAQTLQRSAEKIARSVNLGETIRLVLDQLEQVVPYEKSKVMLVDGSNLLVLDTEGFADEKRESPNVLHYPDYPLIHKSMASGRPIVLADAQNNPDWVELEGSGTPVRAWIGVPLIVSDIVIGYLSIGSSRPDVYSDRDSKAVMAFAQQSAFAINNSRILTELESSLHELGQAEAQLIQTSRLSEAGEIATGVAHQINNPLTTVIAEAHLMLKKMSPDSEGYESAIAIKQAAYRAASVVRRLLDLSRSNPFLMRETDVNESLENAISLIRAQIEPEISLAINLAGDLPSIEASAEHMEDVWLNMLVNAKDAIVEAGKSNRDGVTEINSYFDSAAKAVVVAISDNGSGISDEKSGAYL